MDTGMSVGHKETIQLPSKDNINFFVQRIEHLRQLDVHRKDEIIGPDSLACPGIFNNGCTGSLEQVCTFRQERFWQCVTHSADSNRLYRSSKGCGYRFYPKRRLNKAKLVVSICDKDTVEVVPAEGATRAVNCCGGVEGILHLAVHNFQAIPCRSISRNRVQIPLRKYCLVQSCLKKFMNALPLHCKHEKIFEVDFIPGKTLNCFLGSETKNRSSNEEVEERFARLPPAFCSALLPFQTEGVRYALRRKGRCLIADEMGVGKTVQAIALSVCYRDKWPLLVVVPASLRLCWAEEFEKWIPDLLPIDIHVVFDSSDRIRYRAGSGGALPKITITSYQMLRQLVCERCTSQRHCNAQEDTNCAFDTCMASFGWKMMIVDESHMLATSPSKERDSRMTNAVRTISRKAEHLVFLSGTPSLNKPFDMFNQINMLRDDILPSSRETFACIYCDRRAIPCDYAASGFKYDYSGLSRTNELHLLLKQEVMIRRMKKDVSDQLPHKIRQVVRLPEPSQRDWPDHFQIVKDECGHEKKVNLSPLHRVGMAKCEIACQWLFDKLDLNRESRATSEPIKIVVFAHHKRVMNKIAANLDKKFGEIQPEHGSNIESIDDPLDYVRIDGDTDAQSRHQAVSRFRHSPNARVALVSVTAGGTGLDFSVASAVAFFELPPQASLARQAEDRVHRRGQKNLVNIFFLCAANTYDDRRWQSLNKSLQKVDYVHDGPTQPEESISSRSKKGLAIDSVVRFGLGGLDPTQLSQEDSIDTRLEDKDGSLQTADKKNASSKDRCIIIPDSQSDSDDESFEVADLLLHQNEWESEWKFSVSRNTKRVHIYRSSKDTETFDEVNISLLLSIPLLGATTKDCIKNLLDAYARQSQTSADLMLQGIGPMFVDKTVAPTISIFKRALRLCGQFTREWIEIPNNYRDKLYGQILQPPLDAVLEEVKKDADELGESGVCKSRHIQNITGYLKDFHMNEFLLNRHPVLKGAEPREVSIKHPSGRCTQCIQPIIYKDCGNSSNKIVYLCLNCFKEVPLSATESFEDFRTSTILLFCSTKCERDMKAKVSGGAARRQLMRRDRGICSMCKLDCAKLIRKLQSIEKGPETDSEGNLLWKLQREDLLSRAEYRNFTSRLSKAMKEALIDKALSGKAWQADHIVPVFEGGGQCTVTNLRTLCTACHKDVTAAQASKRQKERALLKRQRQGKMTNARMNEQGGIALGISRLNQGKQQSQDMDSTAGQTREFLKSVQQRKRKYGAESSARV